MQNRRNYYRILHVQQDAPVEIIKTSYRTLMHRMKMHPDLGGEHWQASLINEAYATLSDPEKRSRYDDTIQMSADELREAGAREQTGADSDAEIEEEIPSGELCPFCRTPHYLESIAQDVRCVSCFSPLFPAEQKRHEETSRRAVQRMPKNLPVTFYLEWPNAQGLSGLTLDLSLAGMRFITDLKLPVGKILKIDCDACIAVGQVRNCRFASADKHPHWQIGVQFITLRFKSSRGGFVSEEV
jgi:hypothetical protein